MMEARQDEQVSPALLGVDVGGTTIKARLVTDDDTVLGERTLATPHGDGDATRLAAAIVKLAGWARGIAVAHRAALRAVGFVVPGIVEVDAGIVHHAVNLGWRELPLREIVARALAADGWRLALGFGQDVRAGALAELPATGSAAFVAVGTGVAVTLMSDGQIVTTVPWAGELGQLRLLEGPHAGMRLEEIVSGVELARRAGESEVPALLARLRAGDQAAQAIWDEFIAALAGLLAVVIALGGCATIVLGGGIAQSGEILFGPLAEALRRRLGEELPMPELRPARNGAAAAAIGATLLARAALAAAG